MLRKNVFREKVACTGNYQLTVQSLEDGRYAIKVAKDVKDDFEEKLLELNTTFSASQHESHLEFGDNSKELLLTIQEDVFSFRVGLKTLDGEVNVYFA